MASPIGHVLVGVGLAAGVARATGAEASPALWVGTAVASCVPDLDLIGVLFGLSVRRVHRQATHSLVALCGLILMLGCVWSLLPDEMGLGLALAWSVALLSHPVLDVLTTGPKVEDTGFGIPLLWPLTSRRWFLRHPIVDTDGLMRVRSLREVCDVLLPEIYVLGPVLVAMLLIDHLILRGM